MVLARHAPRLVEVLCSREAGNDREIGELAEDAEHHVINALHDVAECVTRSGDAADVEQTYMRLLILFGIMQGFRDRLLKFRRGRVAMEAGITPNAVYKWERRYAPALADRLYDMIRARKK
jgi:hypothetical protein